MNDSISGTEKFLLIDASGETAGVAVSEGTRVLAKEDLPRAGSVEIISAVGRMMKQVGWKLKDLDAVGVVSGPGSFTGVRVGLAAAKGLCEASSIRMIAISRLQVLAYAVGMMDELLAIDAGRGEFYFCEAAADGAREWLGTIEDALAARERKIIVTETRTAERLAALNPLLYSLHIKDALVPALALYRSRSDNMVLVDANYVHREGDIYKKRLTASAIDIEA